MRKTDTMTKLKDGFTCLLILVRQIKSLTHLEINKHTTQLKRVLASNGFKSLGSEIKDEAVVSKYANQNYILTLSFVSRQEDDYSDVNFTSYYLTMIKKSGVYDEDNGLKKYYDDSGNLTSEYILKDGKMHGIGKVLLHQWNGESHLQILSMGIKTAFHPPTTMKMVERLQSLITRMVYLMAHINCMKQEQIKT